jgi:hypothetical protein
MRDLYRTVAGAIGFFSVGMQYWLRVIGQRQNASLS